MFKFFCFGVEVFAQQERHTILSDRTLKDLRLTKTLWKASLLNTSRLPLSSEFSCMAWQAGPEAGAVRKTYIDIRIGT